MIWGTFLIRSQYTPIFYLLKGDFRLVFEYFLCRVTMQTLINRAALGSVDLQAFDRV